MNPATHGSEGSANGAGVVHGAGAEHRTEACVERWCQAPPGVGAPAADLLKSCEAVKKAAKRFGISQRIRSPAMKEHDT